MSSGYLIKKKTVRSQKPYDCWFCRSHIASGTTYYTYSYLGSAINGKMFTILKPKKVCIACDAKDLAVAYERKPKIFADLAISTKLRNNLRYYGIVTVAQLIKLIKSPSHTWPYGIGVKSIEELREVLR